MPTPPKPHSNALQVQCIPAFDDNYLWLIHNGRDAVAVDPGSAAPIVAALEAQQLRLSAILITHHHADHVGGVVQLLQRQAELASEHGKPLIPVYGPSNEDITGVSIRLAQGQSITLAELNITFQILDLPGHTLGHIAYYAAQQEWLFCGDTLFAGGCGRLFEGSPAQMLDSLGKLAALPDSTSVYCAHEYTLANLKFAREVDANNPDLLERIEREQAKRAHGIATVPSQIGIEKVSNPFLRCQQDAIIARLVETGRLPDGKDPVRTFAALREWKNSYR
jgi:hydroxyacylglutathione hydrolase